MRTFRKIVALVRRRRLHRELAEEVETHRAFLKESAGPAAAKLIGNVTLAREESLEIAQAAGRGVKRMRNLGVAAPGESVVRDLLKMWGYP